MSFHRVGDWSGNRVGQIIVADKPFADRDGHCYVAKQRIELPNGLSLDGVLDTKVSDYLAVGMLAVAVRHAGDFFNSYVPVTIGKDENSDATLTPFLDLQFGAYEFGHQVGRLEDHDISKIAAGVAVHGAGLFWETATLL